MNNSTLYYGNINESLINFLQRESYSKLFILVDENTLSDCYPILNIDQAQIIQIESGEKNKTIHSCQSIWADLLKYKADRQALLINLGGGVIGDMGGFCASTFKRGIRFINIPTTLLAMVDASIGGKTGIDFMQQKNMIGSFTSPHAIFVDPIFLHTLSSRLLLSGKAEMLKHGLIANEAHFKSCLEVLKPDLALIKESISIKDKIVKHDPYEKGIRKSLNFGHTMGHAIESLALIEGEDLLHGEAVALGMILELKLSVLYAGLDSQLATNIIQNLSKIYGQVKLSPSYITSLIDRCENDKKNNSKGINFSLLGQLGQAQNNVSLSPDEILQIAMN